MGKIFILSGATMSGKTTVSKILKEKHNIDRVVSFTTRPIRTGEVDKIDYDFYNIDVAQVLHLSGKAVAVRSYQPHESFGPYPWFYGFEIKKINIEENPFLITDLKGILDMQEVFGKRHIYSIHLDIDEQEQTKRINSRDENLNGEQLRRIESDAKDFVGIENIADHIIKISNKKPETIAKEIAKIIEKNS